MYYLWSDLQQIYKYLYSIIAPKKFYFFIKIFFSRPQTSEDNQAEQIIGRFVVEEGRNDGE